MTWEELESTCGQCTRCSLCQTKTKTVFGTGNRQAKLMFVGEAPGEQEDLSGIPFVGAAGKLLDEYFTAVGIERPEEQDACMAYLREQVKLIKPQMIVCLGRISAMRLIRPDFKITKEHGVLVRKGNYVMTAVYHPSALLRDMSKREDMYKDMKRIRMYCDEYMAEQV